MAAHQTLGVIIGITNIFCVIFIIIAIIVDFINKTKYKSTDNNKNAESFTKTMRCESVSSLFTITAMVLFLLHSSMVALIRLNIYPTDDIFCIWLSRANTASYHALRCLLFTIFIARVHISFKDSVYEYNNRFIIIPLYIFVAVTFIFEMIQDLTTGNVSGYYNMDIHACSATFETWGVLLSAFVDFILSVITLILFIRPLIKLNLMNRMENNIHNVRMNDIKTESHAIQRAQSLSNDISTPTHQHTNNVSQKNSLGALILRYGLLVTISIVSTFILHIAVFLEFVVGISDLITPIDNAINIWCIILIHKANKHIYRKLCWSCHEAM
eukprot:460715_1